MSQKDDLDKLAMKCKGLPFSDLEADDKIDILDLYNERKE